MGALQYSVKIFIKILRRCRGTQNTRLVTSGGCIFKVYVMTNIEHYVRDFPFAHLLHHGTAYVNS
jgi:hypothetical protein